MSNIQPTVPPSVGSKLICDVAQIKSDLASVKLSLLSKVEADASSLESKAKAFFKSVPNWLHIISAGSAASAALKLFGWL